MSETKDTWIELRKPFDPKAVGKLPKGGIQLDYVGHAAVTDRLNTVEPTWTWEPMAFDSFGNPSIVDTVDGFGKHSKGLWIRITINGVTRPAFGDGKTEKEAIGDAIRNGAMRFGVALDLWTKDELESNIENPENKNIKKTDTEQTVKEPLQAMLNRLSTNMAAKLMGSLKLKGYTEKEQVSNILDNLSLIHNKVPKFTNLTEEQGADLYKTIVATTKEALDMLIEME